MKVNNSSGILEEETHRVNRKENEKEEKETELHDIVKRKETVGERIWNIISQR